jgi:5-methylcytosine-specific restriction protein A
MRFCLRPGCPRRVITGYCSDHAPSREALRPNPTARSWYRSPRWRALRGAVLRARPVCPGFQRSDCGRPTTDVDHRVPHRGDPALFWNLANLDAYCHSCHATKTGGGA